MRKWLIVFALLALLATPTAVKAQNTVTFGSLDVSIWPEYDTPAVLVIYKIALAPQTTLPVEITLRLPATVQKLNAVAIGKSFDTVTDQGIEYKFIPGADFANVLIKVTDPYLQLEYYDSALSKKGNQRQYVYDWLGDFPVKDFRFELREPLKSSNLIVEPPLTNTILDSDGFQFSEWKASDLPAGQKQGFTIKYQRNTDSPSTSFLEVQPSYPLDQSVPGQSTWLSYLPWTLGGFGIALLIVAGGVYWATGRTGRAIPRARKRHAAANEETDDEEQLYCAQCGKRAQPSDRFCRACGARIKRSKA